MRRVALAAVLLVLAVGSVRGTTHSAGPEPVFRPFHLPYNERPDASALPVTEATAEPDLPRTGPPAASMSGIASWYRYIAGAAAAGPSLRRALGPGWRGRSVTVCAARCVRVVLRDWCQCYGSRLIDLDARSFAQLAPPSAGLVRVQITY